MGGAKVAALLWRVNIIAAILERPVIEKILKHLGLELEPPPTARARELVRHAVG